MITFKKIFFLFIIFLVRKKLLNFLNYLLFLFKSIFKKKNKLEYVKGKKIGLSFGATGGLFMYSHGVAKFLEENYDLSNIIFAGTSGGCQPCYFLSTQIKMDDALNKWTLPMINLMKKDNYEDNNFISNFKPSILCLNNGMYRSKKFLSKIKINNNKIYDGNKLFLNIFDITIFKQLSISKWRSFDDLFNGIQSTQYIPFILGYPVSIFRNRWCIDGIFGNNHYEPLDDVYWIHINPFKWQKRSFLRGITSLNNFYDINFHLEERKMGYEDAKKNKKIFDILPKKKL